ncbi:MAG: toprim domain-containing protein [Lachnobacterium sp.]|nr:toprim domain-containing protein [Lachnobacterium sp.]
MIDEATIQSAKDVDINKILDNFNWERGHDNMMHCPSTQHVDSTPSCSYNAKNNTVRCFGCGKTFDTIGLYQALSEKVDGRVVSFPKAVKEVLALDNQAPLQGNAAPQSSTTQYSHCNSSAKGNAYQTILSNSRPLTGYELNYLHERGIMLYDSYVYNAKVYTKQSLDKALKGETDAQKIQELNAIQKNGKFFEGIAAILKKNRIQIKHNYWQGVNSIIYLIDYDFDNDFDLQQYAVFLDDERHMAIQKTLDRAHMKKALGTSDFTWLAEGVENKNSKVYICEGMEDALSYVQNGERAVSLNSTSNVNSFMDYLEKHYKIIKKWEFVISFDHDKGGEMAKQKLLDFFQAYNQQHLKYPYKYSVCKYPEDFHDINDYWKDKVFRK